MRFCALLLLIGLLAACGPTATPTVAPTDAATSDVTREATQEATLEATAEATAEVTAEVTEVALTCEQMVDQAFEQIEDACGAVGRNQACYAHDRVEAALREGVEARFDAAGDTVDLLSLQSIRTAPLDAEAREWGIAVVKAQVTLPDTLPGQNVTFLLVGDAELNNPTPDMNAVTIRTGVGDAACESAPAAVLVQAPAGERVEMVINGAGLSLGSTVIITAEPGGEMTIATIEGAAEVTAFDKTELIVPGTQVRLPLSADREAPVVSGPPSKPEAYSLAVARSLPVQLLDRPVEFPEPVTPRLTATPTDEPTPEPTIEPTLQPTREATDDPALTPTATKDITDPQLRSDRSSVRRGECTTIRWEIPPGTNVFFEGQPTRTTSREVCPEQARTYTLLVQDASGEQTPYIIAIRVE